MVKKYRIAFLDANALINPKITTVPEKLILDMYDMVRGRG